MRAFPVADPPRPEGKRPPVKHPAAPLLAQDFGRLQHTNAKGETGILHMPGFLTIGMSEEQVADTLGPLALGLSEAIIETLDVRHDYVLVRRDELGATTREADMDTGLDGVPIHCNRCRQVVIQRLRIGDFVKIHVPTVLAALAAHERDCQ